DYGGAIWKNFGTPVPELGESFFGVSFAGPQVLGMVNAQTLFIDPDTITALFNCPATAPGPRGVGTAGVANSHGNAHSVAADPRHNQISSPLPGTAVATGMNGLCARGGGVDATGCIAVFQSVGADPPPP